jgi:DNA-binding transcriptional regulator YdaS (Cro superfamily)
VQKSPIDRAIDAAGSLTELARRLDVSPQVVVNWRARGVPAERVLEIERATIDESTGEPSVRRSDLRPDLYPPNERAVA